MFHILDNAKACLLYQTREPSQCFLQQFSKNSVLPPFHTAKTVSFHGHSQAAFAANLPLAASFTLQGPYAINLTAKDGLSILQAS